MMADAPASVTRAGGQLFQLAAALIRVRAEQLRRLRAGTGLARAFATGWLLAEAIAAGAIACAILTPLTHPFREVGFQWFLTHRVALLSAAIARVTELGDPQCILPVAVGACTCLTMARRWVLPLVLVVLAVPVCRYLQNFDRIIYHSGAPPQALAIGAVGGSPSGGSLRGVVFWGLAAWAVGLLVGGVRLRRGWLVGAVVAVIAVEGYTRAYLGRHWPVDVLVGYLVGAVLLAGFVRAARADGHHGQPAGASGIPPPSPRCSRRTAGAVVLTAAPLSFLVSLVLALTVLQVAEVTAVLTSLASALVTAGLFLLVRPELSAAGGGLNVYSVR